MARNGKGWFINDLWARRGREEGLRWEAGARDPKRNAYTYKSFPDKLPDGSNGHETAVKWASDQHARLRLGMDSTGTVSLAAVAEEYLKGLEEEGRCAEHRREIKRVVDSLELAGVGDILAKDFPLKVRRHIVNWRDQHKYRRSKVDERGDLVLITKGPRKGQPVREARLLATSTRHRYLGHIKSIADFAVTWDYLSKNPMDKVELDAGESPKETFKIDEVARLAVPGDEPFYWIMLNMIYGGLRFAEAAHLRWEWLDWGGNRMHIRRHPAYRLKGNRERSLPMQPEWRSYFEDQKRKRDIGWLIEDDELRQMLCAPPEKGGKKSPKPDSKKAWKMFRAFVDGRGVDCGERSAHSMRHTWVSAMLASGEDSSFVQLYAGHREIETTLGYAEARDAMRVAVKGWPRGELRFLQRAAELGLVKAA